MVITFIAGYSIVSFVARKLKSRAPDNAQNNDKRDGAGATEDRHDSN